MKTLLIKCLDCSKSKLFGRGEFFDSKKWKLTNQKGASKFSSENEEEIKILLKILNRVWGGSIKKPIYTIIEELENC